MIALVRAKLLTNAQSVSALFELLLRFEEQGKPSERNDREGDGFSDFHLFLDFRSEDVIVGQRK